MIEDTELLEILDGAAVRFGAPAGACKVLADALRYGRRDVVATIELLRRTYPELLEPVPYRAPAHDLPAPLPYSFAGQVAREASAEAFYRKPRNRRRAA